MNVIAEIQRINQAELENGSVGTSASWHAKYADTAWVFVGNLPMQLTEGDVICVIFAVWGGECVVFFGLYICCTSTDC